MEGGLANQDAAESEFKFGSLVGNGESPNPRALPAKVGTGWKLVRHIPSGSRRWHNATDFLSGNDVYGDSFDNGLIEELGISKHLGAKSRWILQGFHDPDIGILNRSVPTPETADVPLALQMLASIQAQAFTADVASAFAQGLKG